MKKFSRLLDLLMSIACCLLTIAGFVKFLIFRFIPIDEFLIGIMFGIITTLTFFYGYLYGFSRFDAFLTNTPPTKGDLMLYIWSIMMGLCGIYLSFDPSRNKILFISGSIFFLGGGIWELTSYIRKSKHRE